MQHSDSVPCFLGHANLVCVFPMCAALSVRACLVRARVNVIFIVEIPVSCPISDEQIFPRDSLQSSLNPPKNTKQSTERSLPCVTCVCVCVCWLVAVCQGAKLFWIGPSHLVTTAENDRGVVGQSGVGVLNELSCIQPASVSRGMNEWPDSLFTSSFLSDFPDLLPPATSLPPLFNFVTLVSP